MWETPEHRTRPASKAFASSRPLRRSPRPRDYGMAAHGLELRAVFLLLLALHRVAKPRRIVDQGEVFLGAAGADHDHGAEIEQPADQALLHAHGFDAGEIDLDGLAREKAGLDDDAAGGDGELAAGLLDPGHQAGDQA